MKGMFKKPISLILCFVMVFTVLTGTIISTSAKVVGPDNKTELTIKTDKPKYSWGDTVTFNITVKNVTNDVLTGIRIDSFARAYTKVAQQGNLPVIARLEPGESETVQIEYYTTHLVGAAAIFFPIIWLFNPVARIAYREANFNYEYKVKVGAFKYRVGFAVEYNYISEINDYYQENSEKIIEVIKVEESQTVQSENDALAFLHDRGFTKYEITYDSTITGEYIEDTEAKEGSPTKHPMYQTYYISSKGDVWTIFVINGKIFANPASYNLESDLDAQVLISESNQLTSYDDEGNQFYVTIPKSSAVVVKTVSRIDASTLDNYIFE